MFRLTDLANLKLKTTFAFLFPGISNLQNQNNLLWSLGLNFKNMPQAMVVM